MYRQHPDYKIYGHLPLMDMNEGIVLPVKSKPFRFQQHVYHVFVLTEWWHWEQMVQNLIQIMSNEIQE